MNHISLETDIQKRAQFSFIPFYLIMNESETNLPKQNWHILFLASNPLKIEKFILIFIKKCLSIKLYLNFKNIILLSFFFFFETRRGGKYLFSQINSDLNQIYRFSKLIRSINFRLKIEMLSQF